VVLAALGPPLVFPSENIPAIHAVAAQFTIVCDE
jgi:hypothetical protein